MCICILALVLRHAKCIFCTPHYKYYQFCTALLHSKPPHYLINDPVFGGIRNIFNVKGKSTILILSTILKHFLILRRIIESLLYMNTGLHNTVCDSSRRNKNTRTRIIDKIFPLKNAGSCKPV